MSVAPSSPRTESRRSDRTQGLVIVGVTFVFCLLLSLWAQRRAQPLQSVEPAPPTTFGLTGFPHAIDALKTLARARALTPRDLLRGISAYAVNSSGLLDVTANGRVRYTFQSASEQGPQPRREPGTLAPRPYCGQQSVSIGKSGIEAEPDNARARCVAHPSEPLPVPPCSLADVWAYAVAHGADRSQPASIDYYRAEAGPAWRFHGSGGNRFTISGDCKNSLRGREAVAVAF